MQSPSAVGRSEHPIGASNRILLPNQSRTVRGTEVTSDMTIPTGRYKRHGTEINLILHKE